MCRKYSRSRAKAGRSTREGPSHISKIAGTGGVTRTELGNLLENFKNNILGTLSSQFDALKTKRWQEEEDIAALHIFCPKCRKRHPLKECPLNIISVFVLCFLTNTLLTIALDYQNCKLFKSLIMNLWINHMHQKGPSILDPKTSTQSLFFQILHITIPCSNLNSHGVHKCGRIGLLSLLKPNHGSKVGKDSPMGNFRDSPMEEHNQQPRYTTLLVTVQ